MNYDLAMMALDGLARSPLSIVVEKSEVVIEAEPAAFKEFARLCLLLGGSSEEGEAIELQQGVHINGAPLRLRLPSR